MMDTKKISLIVIILLLTINFVSAFGIGVINNMDYREVTKKEEYVRDFRVTVFDPRYYPYTDIHINKTYDLIITATDDNIIVPEDLTIKLNQFNVPYWITLKVPKNIKKGDYLNRICAFVISEGMVNPGACADLHYKVVPKGKLK